MSYKVFQQVVEKAIGEKLQPEYRFHPTRRWRFDFAIERLKIAIEIEGAVWTRGRHTRGSGFVKDLEKYNAATSLGWLVLRFSSHEIYSKKTLDTIKETVKNAVSINQTE